MSLALILVVAGFLIVSGGFIFALFNLIPNTPTGRVRPDNVFPKHIASMIIMAFGALLFVIGIVVGVVELLTRVLP